LTRDVLYGLIASDSAFAVDVFLTAGAAAEALAEVLHDEPAFIDLLSIAVLPLPDDEEPCTN
jgi:hypothetical protein